MVMVALDMKGCSCSRCGGGLVDLDVRHGWCG